MAADGIRITGLRDTVRNLEAAGVDLSNLKDAFRRIGAIVSGRGKSLAPRRTGALAASIRPSRSKNRAKVSAGSTRVPYAAAIHWGYPKRNIAPHPFLTEALDQTKPKVLGAVEHEIDQLTRKANR